MSTRGKRQRGQRAFSGGQQGRPRGGRLPQEQRNIAANRRPAPAPPLGEIVTTITHSDILTKSRDEEEQNRIAGVEMLASFNWIKGPSPKIVFPGKPRRWTPPRDTERLDEDEGIFYRDRNAAAYPKHPMEPTVVSVMRMRPYASCLDVVACASTLHKLLMYVQEDDGPFRMLVEVVGNTIHLIRRESSPKEQISGIRGYGHSFPEAYTTWDADLASSLSYQRVIKYCLGGLKIMVRFEPDGYLDPGDKEPSRAEQEKVEGDRTRTCEPEASRKTELIVDTGGRIVLQDTIFDIKTRSTFRKIREVLTEQLPRLWFTQIPNMILARHKHGIFEDISIIDVRDKVKSWEQENGAVIKRFVALLRCVFEISMRQKATKLELTRDEGGELKVRKRLSGAGQVFSEPVRAQWKDRLEDEWNRDSEEGEGANLYVASDKDESWSGSEQDLTYCTEDCAYCGRCSF